MNKHTATDPNGQIHTRNSKTRTYSHCVVARLDREACEAQLLKSAEQKSETNYDYYCGKGSHNPYTDYKGEPRTYVIHGKDYSNAEEYMADYPTLQDDIDYEVDRAQKIIDSRSSEYYDEYFSLGWNGRLDLAQKLVSKECNIPRYRDITILEAAIK